MYIKKDTFFFVQNNHFNKKYKSTNPTEKWIFPIRVFNIIDFAFFLNSKKKS